jgi:hypothetical protein
MDIEGAELYALHGSSRLLSLPDTKAAISVYHKYDDIRQIGLYLLPTERNFILSNVKIIISETMMYISSIIRKRLQIESRSNSRK